MSEKIREIDGKKYWKNYNVTPEVSNEKIDPNNYNAENRDTTTAQDMYFFFKNKPSFEKPEVMPQYNKMKDDVLKFYSDAIDEEMSKNAAGMDFYQNKLNEMNNKKGTYRVQTAPAFTPKERDYKYKKYKYARNIRMLDMMYDEVKNGEIDPDIYVFLYNKYIDPDMAEYKKQLEEEKKAKELNNKDTKVISNPYKLEPPENYLKEPIKTPTMEKVENIRDKGVKTGEIKAQKPKLKKPKKKATIEIDDNLKKEMEYQKYIEKIVDDFKAKNPKANISEDENTKIWILENGRYLADPHRVLKVIKKHPELLKDEDLHKVYIDLMQKTKDLTPGGERAERGYKV
jgi:hypothetical protein